MKKLILSLCTLITLLTPLSASDLSATTDKPNIVLIYADDLGLGMLGHKGQKIVTTPNIDKLAKQGMSFTNYYGNTYCAPARWSLLTGMHDGRRGSGSHSSGGFIVNLDKKKPPEQQWQQQFNNHISKREKATKHPVHEQFLAQFAQKGGYKTAQFGKLDVGFLTWHNRLLRHGWDHYVGYYDHQRAHGFYPAYLWKNGAKLPLTGNTKSNAGKRSEAGTEPVGSGGVTYSQDIFLEEMLYFIKANKKQRFFLYHSTQLPHGPVAVNEIHADFKDRNDLTISEKKYASMVKMLDEHVGILVKELKEQGLENKTAIFFTSDNGHETYYRNKKGQLPKNQYRRHAKSDGSKANMTDNKWRSGEDGDIFNGTAGMTGLKWTTFEGGVYCPMIVKWPGKVKPSSECDRLTSHYDFMPTLAAIAQVTPPTNKDGKSYFAHLIDSSNKEENDWIFINGAGPTTRSALITKDGWKLVQLKNKSFQLYSTKQNHFEEHNLAAKHPNKVKQLITIFNREQHSKRPDLQQN